MSFIPINNSNKHPDAIPKYTISKMGHNIPTICKRSHKRRAARCMSVSGDVLDAHVQYRCRSVDLGKVGTRHDLEGAQVQIVIAGRPIGVTRNLKPGCHNVKDIINAIAPILRTVVFPKSQLQSMDKVSKEQNKTLPLNRVIHFIFTPQAQDSNLLVCRRCVTTQPNRVFVVPPTLQLI